VMIFLHTAPFMLLVLEMRIFWRRRFDRNSESVGV
jgi:hypothetical protein